MSKKTLTDREKINEANFSIEAVSFLLQHLDLTEIDNLAETSIYLNRVGKIIYKFSSEIFAVVENQES